MTPFIETLRQRAAALRRRIVLPEGDDERILEAAARLEAGGLARPIVLGEPERIRARIEAYDHRALEVETADPRTDPRRAAFARQLAERRSGRGLTPEAALEQLADPLFFGDMLVRTGAAHGSLAGAARTTGDVLRAAIACIGTTPGIETVSSSFYMIVQAFRGGTTPEVLTFTDAGVVPEPDAEQLVEIALAAAQARREIVRDEPRVAFLSYSTHGSADGESVRKMRSAAKMFAARAPDIVSDGELQGDAALIDSVAARKAPGSAVAGNANILVFPDLGAANIAYKLVQRLAHAEALGPVLQGLALPCNDLSRGATVEDIVNVACITALQGQDEVRQARPGAGDGH